MTYEKHGLRHCGLYMHWANIKNRCYNKKSPRWKDWGGKGITMHEPWKQSFKTFYDYITKLPNYEIEGFNSIDRINNNKGYIPGNIRWANIEMQNNNKSNVYKITYNGKTQNLAQWAKELKLGKDTIHNRHRKGWTDIECLFGKGVVKNDSVSISKRHTRKNKK